jgi:hypothetical protein
MLDFNEFQKCSHLSVELHNVLMYSNNFLKYMRFFSAL